MPEVITRSYVVRATLFAVPHPCAGLTDYCAAMGGSADLRIAEALAEALAARGGPWTFPGIIAADIAGAVNQAIVTINALPSTAKLETVPPDRRWIRSGSLHIVIGRLLQSGEPGAPGERGTLTLSDYAREYHIDYKVLARFDVS